MTKSQDYIVDRLCFFGLRYSEAVQMTRTVQKWTESNGPEWTVNRLKDLKQLYLRYWALEPRQQTKSWLALDANGMPKGIFKCIFYGLQSDRRRMRMLNALMSYSSFISTKVTNAQWKKFHDSVTAPPVEETFVFEIPENWKLRQWSTHLPVDITSFPLSKEKRTTDGHRSVPESDVLKWFAYAARLDIIRDVLHSNVKVLPHPTTLRTMLWSEFARNHEPTHSYVGNIAFIQETGFKLRAVANPNRIIQILLEPLKTALKRCLEVIPQDCTFDQAKAIPVVQKWLQEGYTVSSVDLSDATNFFPLSLTLKLLKAMDENGKRGWQPYIELFKQASMGLWKVPGKEPIRWTKGQPLGLGPSFFAFSLSHHLVMNMLSIQDYFILGDDVVIRNLEDASRYREMLNRLACPVSEGKTLTSSRLAEFAGKIITPRDVVSPLKWRQVSDINFMDQVRNLGPKSVRFLTKDQRLGVKLVSEIPEWMGGLGWNPKGKTLGERISDNLSVIRELDAASLQPVRKDGIIGEIQQYLLTHHLTRTAGMPHESFGEASSTEEVRDPRTYHRVLHITGVREERMPSVEDGWMPLQRVSDPRAIPPALKLARALRLKQQ